MNFFSSFLDLWGWDRSWKIHEDQWYPLLYWSVIFGKTRSMSWSRYICILVCIPLQLQLLLEISCHVLWRMKSFLFEIVNFKKWKVFFGRCFYKFVCLFQDGTRFDFMVKIDECQITKLHDNSNGMKICELNRFWNGLMVELSQCQKYRHQIQLLLIFCVEIT